MNNFINICITLTRCAITIWVAYIWGMLSITHDAPQNLDYTILAALVLLWGDKSIDAMALLKKK